MATPSSRFKKVLVVTPVLLLGGTEMQMLSMVRILSHNGYRVSVCCCYEHDPRIVDEFRSASSTVELLNLDRSKGKRKLQQLLTLFQALVNLFRLHKDSIVHVQYVAPGLVPILAAKVSGIRTIFATIHYPRHAFGVKELFFVRLASRLCTQFFCNSTATERSWFGNSSRFDASMKSDVSHCTLFNGVDEKQISSLSSSVDRGPIRKEMGIGGEKVVGVVGRLRSEKGHEFLFHAMKNVFGSVPTARLLIVGEGPEKNRLRALAVELGIDRSIMWMGAKTQEETFCLYGIMDVVVVPSIFEGFGLTAAEAMAAAVPVVASNVDGLRDIVDDNSTGLLVPYGDVWRMTEAILRILCDEVLGKKMGMAGHEKIANQFSMPQYATLLLAAYDRYSQDA